MKTQIARREFIRRAGIAAGSLSAGSLLFDSILAQFMNQALAAAVGDPIAAALGGMNYVHMSFPGAPPRWMFDLPLTTDGLPNSSNFVQGAFGNTFVSNTSGTGMLTEYQAVECQVGGRSLYLPPVWKMGTSSQDFTQLLSNTLFVRGMNNQINSHQLSNQMQVAPIVGGFSMTGVVADKSSLPIPCIESPGVPASNVFRSAKSYAASVISNSTDPAVTLLAPFSDFVSTRQVTSPAVGSSTQAVFQAFEAYAANHGFSPNVLPQMYDNAMTLIESNVYQMSNQWNAVYAKYDALVKAALAPGSNIPGLTDKVIVASATDKRFNSYSTGAVSAPVDLPDMRDAITSAVDAPGMAANFALTEMLIGQLSSSFCLGFGPLTGLTGTTAGTLLNITHDQHFMGNMFATLVDTFYYRAFLSCLTEFVAQLKAKQIFGNTVIHIAAEFNRAPRTDGSGADHGYLGSNATLISGMLAGGVVGNILKDGGIVGYPGTWGVAASYPMDGITRAIQQNDVARQLSIMMGVNDIVTNGMVFLQKTDAGWVPRGGANNV